jgi:hypothetical protein
MPQSMVTHQPSPPLLPLLLLICVTAAALLAACGAQSTQPNVQLLPLTYETDDYEVGTRFVAITCPRSRSAAGVAQTHAVLRPKGAFAAAANVYCRRHRGLPAARSILPP